MAPTRMRAFAFGFIGLCFPLLAQFSRAQRTASSDFAVHEWGTFTSIAGGQGQAVRWLPLSGNDDLPSFVEHFQRNGFKAGLNGTVRMETPVLYFYAPRRMSVGVHVTFSKGVITEWYPHPSGVEPTSLLTDVSLYDKNAVDGTISWDSVALDPGSTPNLPREDLVSRYYAARETSATPVTVPAPNGDEQEKFLFYRGVSVFPVPVSATPAGNGRIIVGNLGAYAIPKVILFERRGNRLGYRIGGEIDKELVLESPELTGTVDGLENELLSILVTQGLYVDEARAMIRTWGDSWFEEGSRLIYVVPARFVDTVLPLSIDPKPETTVRVFVGRLELVTPATKREVETALETHNNATLEKFGRFLDPIVAEILRDSDPQRASTLDADVTWFYRSRVPPASFGSR